MATKENDNEKPAAAAPPAEGGGEAKAKPARPKGEGGGKKGKKEPTGPAPKYKREKPPRLRSLYDQTVKPAMMKEFNYSSVMEVPRILKVSLNMGLGKAKEDAKVIDNAIEELKAICGQAPVVTRAKKD